MDTKARPASAERLRVRRRRRARAVSAVLTVAVLLAAAIALSVGDFPISLSDIGWTLLGKGSRTTDFAILEIRLPRLLTGVFAGIAFGVAGAVFQSVLRNPLASPDILGVTAGASAAAVTGIVLLGLAATATAASALAGAVLTMAVIYLLAWRSGTAGMRVVLVGIGISTMLLAVVSFLLTRAQVTIAQQALVWLSGSLAARSWQQAVPLMVGVLALVPVALLFSGRVRMLMLGDEVAAGLGVPVERTRIAVIAAAVGLAALATAAAGPIQFVALMSAPIARRLTGAGPAMAVAGLVGAVLVTVADLAGKHVFATQIPVGVLTGLVGAPYLLWTLTRSR